MRVRASSLYIIEFTLFFVHFTHSHVSSATEVRLPDIETVSTASHAGFPHFGRESLTSCQKLLAAQFRLGESKEWIEGQ